MRDGRCPKCGQETIHVMPRESILIFGLTSARVDHYVCTNCGYMERYINDAGKLAEIAEKWPSVTAEDPGHEEQETRRL